MLAEVDSKLAQVDPRWPMLAPSEPHDGPSSKVSPRPAKVFTKALPLRPRFSQMSMKALPQAFRRLIFRSGCSIVLFSNLKVVSFWVRLSDCPVMAGLSKRFIQTFLPSGSCSSSFLKLHPFLCIARRHSSTYTYKKIGLRAFASFRANVDSGRSSRRSF